jgi:DNA-binding MltR family transcriptional regulator
MGALHFPPDLVDIIDEIQSQSDRGAATLAGGILSEYLKLAILKSFESTSKRRQEKMFSGYGPLSTFAARIEIAYSLKVFHEKIYDYLIIIKSIRNEFAHSIQPTNFQSEEIKKLCAKLNLGDDLMTIHARNPERAQYLQAVVICLAYISGNAIPDLSLERAS